MELYDKALKDLKEFTSLFHNNSTLRINKLVING